MYIFLISMTMINLHQQFLQLASQKNQITYKLLKLLPEIYSSEIYKKYAKTIQGYAYRFAQIPESTVNKTLNLEKDLIDKPLLKNAIESVGVHKVALVAKLVTPENESLFVEKLQTMSKSAIQEMSKEIRGNEKPKTQTITINLDPELQKLWNTMQKQLNTTENENTLNEVLKLAFKALNEEKAVVEITDKEKSPVKSISRYIPTKLKQETIKKFNNYCAYPNCAHKATEIHHINRFSKTHNHENLVSLCEIHHQFAHNALIANESDDPQNWKMKLQKTTDEIDLKYQKNRM